MKIKHIVSTRFLYNILFNDNRNFDKEYQIKATKILLNNFYNTLLNQTNTNFEVVIITHKDNKQYVNSISFPIQTKVFTYSELHEYIKSIKNKYDYIIDTNCDYDDFFHKDNINIIQKSIKPTTTFKMFGFINGATLIENENEPRLFKPAYVGITGFFSCCTSIIYKSDLLNNDNFPMVIHDVAAKYDGNHPSWKNIIKNEYINWGLTKLDDDFFDFINEDTIRFIWIRQQLSYTSIKINQDNRSPHDSDIILTLKLKEDFGIPW